MSNVPRSVSAAAAPFKRNAETLEEAVDEQLKVSDELRQIRELVAQKDADLIALRTQITQVAADSLRAVTAATTASANSELVLKGFAQLRKDLAKHFGNGHG